MSLIARLSDLIHGLVSPDPESRLGAAHVTVAALLALVARVDGRLLPVEENGLESLLRSRFALSADEIEHLLARADAADEGLDAASTVAERIVHDIAPEDRPQLLAMAYRIAAADGQVHDFEDDLVWRVGRLLGLTDPVIAAIREGALADSMAREAPGA